MTITPEQCRAARTLRGWSLSRLAAASGIAESIIDEFELERRPPDPAAGDALRRAFENAGLVFLPGGDVRLPAEAPARR